MKTEQIDRHLEDNRGDIASAVFKVLTEWQTAQNDPTSAYETLRQGLIECNLSTHIQVLKPE